MLKIVSKYRILVILLALLFTIGYFYEGNAEPFIMLLLFATLLIYSIGSLEKQGKILENKFTKFIGNISLEIYLCHMVFYRLIEKLHLGVPYFTFSIITLVLKIVFSSEVNNQATPILRTLFIEPIAPYWYLYTLFFLFCIVPYFKDKQLMKKIFVGAVFFKVLYVVWLCNFNLPDIVNKILANLVWFLLGMLISEIYMSKTLIKDWMNVVILGVGLGISWIYYSKPLENNVLQFVIGSCMIFPILYFFMSISPDKEGRFVHKLNQYFMPVYVLHTIIAAMLRSILLKIGIANFLLHFSIELIASILIPIVIYEIASKNWILLFWFEPVKALKMKRKKNEN